MAYMAVIEVDRIECPARSGIPARSQSLCIRLAMVLMPIGELLYLQNKAVKSWLIRVQCKGAMKALLP